MKPYSVIIAALALAGTLAACSEDEAKTTWEEYADWREVNNTWVTQQEQRKDAGGNPLFKRFVPAYNSGVFLLQRTIGDSNPQNLTPLYTSTAKVNYQVHLYNDSLVDQGTLTTQLNSQTLISGWAMALMNMHVGDSAEVIMPYMVAYGPSGTSGIPPYSALRFNLRLVDIPTYQVRP